MSYKTQNTCDKTNTLPKIKNCEKYTIICIHYLVLEYSTRNKQINREIAQTQRNSGRKPTTVSRKNGIRQYTIIHRNQQEQNR